MARAKWIFGAQNPQVPQDISKPLPVPVLASADAKKFGFENFGNTCYANSVIQTLYFCAPFRDLMLQSTDTSLSKSLTVPLTPSTPITPAPPPPVPLAPVRLKPVRKPSTSGPAPTDLSIPNGPPSAPVAPIPVAPPTLFSALRSLFFYISSHPAEKGTVSPRAFVDKLKELNQLFNSTMHQDAHEFLIYLLNQIVEEIEEERKLQASPQVESVGDVDLSNSLTTLMSKAPTTSSNSGHSHKDATLVHRLFEGVLTSETRCLTCETVSSRDESFLDLSIDIEQNSSVTACLRQFSASEMLCQKNKFFCDSCCDLQEAEKRMKIKKLPNVLALHLKRFKYQEDVQRNIKLAYRVAFPFELRLFNTVDDMDDADRLYNLYAIVVHIGNNPHHGHYVSIIKTLGVWLLFDDDNVTPVPENEISKYFGDSPAGSAYVLYYQAADIDLTGLGLRTSPASDSEASVSSPLPGQAHSQDLHSQPVLPPGLLSEESRRASDPSLSDPSLAVASTPLSVPPPYPYDGPNNKYSPPPPSSESGSLPTPSPLTPTTPAFSPAPTTIPTSSSSGSGVGSFLGIRKMPSTQIKNAFNFPGASLAAEARRSINAERSLKIAVGNNGSNSTDIPSPTDAYAAATPRTPGSRSSATMASSLPSSMAGTSATLKSMAEAVPMPVTNGMASSPALVAPNGKEGDKEKEQKPKSTWFPKRKSFRIGEKSKTLPTNGLDGTGDRMPPSPAIPPRSSRGGDDAAAGQQMAGSSSSSTSSARLRSSMQKQQPLEAEGSDVHQGPNSTWTGSDVPRPASAHQTRFSSQHPSSPSASSQPSRPVSMQQSERNPQKHKHRHQPHHHPPRPENGHSRTHSPSSSFDSSIPRTIKSDSNSTFHSPPQMQLSTSTPPPYTDTQGEFPKVLQPVRKQSLATISQTAPEGKRSAHNFPGSRDKDKGRSKDKDASVGRTYRPSTTGSIPMNGQAPGGDDRSLPPLPQLPSRGHRRHTSGGSRGSGSVDGSDEGLVKGRTQPPGGGMDVDTNGAAGNVIPSPSRASSSPQVRGNQSFGLVSFGSANHSTGSSSTSATSLNIKRATRKLSLTAPMLGFGKKERQKDKDKEKAAPSSFMRF